MTAPTEKECCPRFDPALWNEKEMVWENKLFVQDRVTSFLHIPLNFGSIMTKNMARIEAAGALQNNMVVLSDDTSLWCSLVYLEVAKDVPGARMTTISGTFLSKVFEGPYRNIKNWIEEMRAFVNAKGKTLQKFYFYYTTCPKCARKFGKNYVVILAQI